MAIRISVVTPSYNQAAFLEETLRSVLSQRDQIHEYFVLDGGSTDGSADIIRRYAERGGIDYWHSRKDKGQSDAIDQGFRRATGDYLAWINSDDVFLPGALARVRAALETNPSWDAVTGYHVQIDQESRIIGVYRIPAESPRMAHWGVIHVAQQTCFFRKSLYERVGGLDLSLHTSMDTELWIRMFKAGATWGHIPEFLAAFRVHPAAKGSSWLQRYAEERVIVHGRYPEYLETRRRRVGLAYYRLTQILSGRYGRARRQTRQLKGKKLDDVLDDLKPAVPR